MEIHLNQRVPYKVSKATAIEVAVGMGVEFVIVDLRKLQTSVFMEILPMEVLMGTEHLHRFKKTKKATQVITEIQVMKVLLKCQHVAKSN